MTATTRDPARPGQRTTALDARYGRTPGRRRRRIVAASIAAAVVAALVVAWSVWTGVGGAVGALQFSTLGYDPQARSVQVTWEVDGRPTQRLVCAVEAQSTDGATVGMREVVVPVTGSATRKGTTVVRIVRAADNGLIASCRDA